MGYIMNIRKGLLKMNFSKPILQFVSPDTYRGVPQGSVRGVVHAIIGDHMLVTYTHRKPGNTLAELVSVATAADGHWMFKPAPDKTND